MKKKANMDMKYDFCTILYQKLGDFVVGLLSEENQVERD